MPPHSSSNKKDGELGPGTRVAIASVVAVLGVLLPATWFVRGWYDQREIEVARQELREVSFAYDLAYNNREQGLTVPHPLIPGKVISFGAAPPRKPAP